MNNQENFMQFALRCLDYKSEQNLYEKLYLKAIIDSYQRIDKTIDIENIIRDRFVFDLERKNHLTRNLVQKGILQLDFERTHFVSENEKRRTDIVFFISGFGNFIIECKRLFKQDSKNNDYINEGVKRFIDSKYSKNNNYSGMLGFIVEGETDKIKTSLLKKCETVNYLKNEFTEQKYIDWVNSFKTAHLRNDNSEIKIYHLLFEFNNN